MVLTDILKLYSDYIEKNPTLLSLVEDKVGIEPIFDNPKIGILWVPDQAKGRCTQGIVKCIGPLVKDYAIGDYVIFSGYNGDLVAYQDGLYIIMPEDMIAGKVVDDDIVTLEEEFGESITSPLKEILRQLAYKVKPKTVMTNKLSSRDKPV